MDDMTQRLIIVEERKDLILLLIASDLLPRLLRGTRRLSHARLAVS